MTNIEIKTYTSSASSLARLHVFLHLFFYLKLKHPPGLVVLYLLFPSSVYDHY